MNQKIDPEESSLCPSHKSGQSKSLQRLKHKVAYEPLSDSLKPKENHPIKKQTSQKFLKSSKFDTPEKKNSPKPLRDLQKSPFTSKPTPSQTPFPSNIQLFSKKNIGKLIQTSKLNTNPQKKFNPMHLAPVLFTRKPKDVEKPPNVQIIPLEVTLDTITESKVQTAETQVCIEEEEKTLSPSTLLFYSKGSQPSFGEEFDEDPVFLSDRLSYENESSQSPKFETKKVETENWEFSEILQKNSEKLDCETQTDEDALEGILSFLNDHDIQTGIRFIAKIAKFVQTLT